ncbi:SHOC2 [Symbiodinium pilosum]|uniref:SHOC2 protein n=1 Tax=Symbiodinium pilosum TaxID=2952 RepID=A0A812IV06_SYMPI|nr:SHOC2 [Symbiodinium pilosum]
MLTSTALGLVTGIVIYFKSSVFYYHYTGAATYRSVVPSQPAETILDAGVVNFAVGSGVDASRSVGFQSAADAALICVAPIVDASMKPQTPVSLYAYGVNCCSFRGSFHCDDALNPNARYGFVRPEPTAVLPPLLADLASGPSEETLAAAVRLQQASYGGSEKHVRNIFVRYVNDPLAAKMSFVDTAVLAGVSCSSLFLAGLLASASVVVLGAGKVGLILKRLVV